MSGPGAWQTPSTNSLMPWPDCSVTSLSSVISIPTNLHMSLVSSKHQQEQSSPCDDPFFLKQVASHVRKKVMDKLDEICGHSLYCDVTDLEAVCGDILKIQHVITNEVFRRRRDTKVITSSLQYGDGDQKQLIDIQFKLVGSYKNYISGQYQQKSFVDDVADVKKMVTDYSDSGELDVEIGKDLLMVETLKFGDLDFVCASGAVAYHNTCVNCPGNNQSEIRFS